MNTQTLEEIAEAFNNSNEKKLLEIIEKEIEKATEKGYMKNVSHLKRVARSITAKQQKKPEVGGQSIYLKPASERLFDRVESRVELEEIILDDESRATLSDFIKQWDHRDTLKKHDLLPSNKVLLYGPPGTGKTKLAYALARKLDMPLVVVRLDELISSFLGDTGKNIRRIFEMAKMESLVIFLDEFDTMAKYRNDAKELGELKRVVTVLLQNIDCFGENSILIAATNHQELLDNAIWRRFPTKLQFSLPSEEKRELLVRVFLKNFKLDKQIDYKLIATITERLSGAQIEELCLQSKRRVVLEGRSSIRTTDLAEVLVKNQVELEKLPKKSLYLMGKVLRKMGYKTSEVARLMKIPYTTLRDNL